MALPPLSPGADQVARMLSEHLSYPASARLVHQGAVSSGVAGSSVSVRVALWSVRPRTWSGEGADF